MLIAGPARNINARVAEHLGTSIVCGEVAPGHALPSEMRICEMLGVSRTAVREAIRVLSGKGLVEARPRSGTRVRSPELWNQFDPDVLRWQMASADLEPYLAKLFALRAAVEPMAAEQAARNALDLDLVRIRAAADAMAAAPDEAAWIEGDVAFHRSIHVATRNEFFWPIAQIFEATLRRSFAATAGGDNRDRALREHRRVMEAIVSRDPAEARDAMTALIESSAEDVNRILAIDPLPSGARRTGASEAADRRTGRPARDPETAARARTPRDR